LRVFIAEILILLMQVRTLAAQVIALIAEISDCGCQFRNFLLHGIGDSGGIRMGSRRGFASRKSDYQSQR